MKRPFVCSLRWPVAAVLLLAGVWAAFTQTARPRQTMRPVIRGTHYAVASMKPEATLAAERILQAGGNAFDAIVAGQAVLGMVDAAMNGVGSDAVVLIYDAEDGQGAVAQRRGHRAQAGHHRVVQEEPRRQDSGGRHAAFGHRAGRGGRLVHAARPLGHHELRAGARCRPSRWPRTASRINDRLAQRHRGSKKLRKYPTSMKRLSAGRQVSRSRARSFAIRTWRARCGGWWKPRSESAGQGRREALRAARDRFYKGDIAREMAEFSEQNGGLFRYEDFAAYTAKVEEPVSMDYRGYRVYKNPSATQGPAELFLLNILEGYDLKKLGLQQRRLHPHVAPKPSSWPSPIARSISATWTSSRSRTKGCSRRTTRAERRTLIDPEKASLELRPGVAEKFMPGMEPLERPRGLHARRRGRPRGRHQLHRRGGQGPQHGHASRPACTARSARASSWADLGFIFNCRGDYYSLMPGQANALEPGKRPRSTLQSTLVIKDGKPFLVTGQPGRRRPVPAHDADAS